MENPLLPRQAQLLGRSPSRAAVTEVTSAAP